VKLHEYQAKSLLTRFQIPVPAGAVATTAAEARAVAERLAGRRCVIKAQVHAGGRGKAGGIQLADGPAGVEAAAARILGMRLVSAQTGAEGRLVRSVLVEEGVEIERELYLSVIVDRARARLLVMASREGGMEIEEVAQRNPEAIVRESIDPLIGIRPYQARRLALRLGLGGSLLRPAVAFVTGLHRLVVEADASLAEVNPLVVTRQGALLALDCKLNLDDNALYRHPDLQALRDSNEEAPLEVEASRYNLSYIKLDGEVGCMVNGAGLAMATMDIIKLAGRSPANFLDVGGGADVERIANAFRILTSDRDVRAVLINIFGGIVRCDRVAEGIIEALKTVRVELPIVVRLAGTNAAEAALILERSGLRFTVAHTLAEAADQVVKSLPQGS
jgi:succinyl-CoA synthetase beta subunit